MANHRNNAGGPGLLDDPAPPVAVPVMMTNAYVEIGGANLRLLAMEVYIEAENSPIELVTFGGVRDYPGPTKYHFRVKLAQSFDPGATDETLREALEDYESTGAAVDFKVRPYAGRAISATNPSLEGSAIPQPYNIFGGAAGAASEVEIDWIMDAPPTRVTTPASSSAAA